MGEAQQAGNSTTVSRITPSDEERAAKRFDVETIEFAAQSVRIAGALILDDIIDRNHP